MAYEGKEIAQGGPWGYRHQFTIADSGYGPRVHNDRAGEVCRTLNIKDFDLERIFIKEGVQIMHLSGLIAALSPETGCLFALNSSGPRKNTAPDLISFDLNYRASFRENREAVLHRIFAAIAGMADILVENEEDFQLCLGIAGPEADGRDMTAKIESFKGMIERVKKACPDVSVFATTLREVISTNRHLWAPSVPKTPTGMSWNHTK
jgi:2-dehydro-3-deoxygluconokinase